VPVRIVGESAKHKRKQHDSRQFSRHHANQDYGPQEPDSLLFL
jgi:hypothetical protein